MGEERGDKEGDRKRREKRGEHRGWAEPKLGTGNCLEFPSG